MKVLISYSTSNMQPSTVKLWTEVPGFYQYKSIRPTGLYAGPGVYPGPGFYPKFYCIFSQISSTS